MTSPSRLRLPAVLAIWGAGIALGALSVGCGLILSVDYDDATIDRNRSGAADGGFSGPCAPRACAADECGLVDDGCQGVMTCNACPSGSECNAGRCRCRGQTCPERSAVCGTFDNGCGTSKALECGTCTVAQQGCTDDGQCKCQPTACPDGGAAVACGNAPSGCGERYVCGPVECPLIPNETDPDASVPGICGGGGQNLCGAAPCVPVACAPGECGQKSNGCNDVLACGECEAGVCGANGIANQCGCEKTSCARLGLTCGPAPDGCGGMLDCGGCEAPETCGAAGSCGCAKTDRNVACAGKTCGYAPDGCRSFHVCGPACPYAGP